MEVNEQAWAKLRADVTIIRAAVVGLMQLHPRREEIIGALQQSANEAGELLLGTTSPDAQIAALADRVAAFVAECRNTK